MSALSAIGGGYTGRTPAYKNVGGQVVAGQQPWQKEKLAEDMYNMATREYARRGGTYAVGADGRPGAPLDKYAWAGAGDKVSKYVGGPLANYSVETAMREEDKAKAEEAYQKDLQRRRDTDEMDQIDYQQEMRKFGRNMLRNSRLGMSGLGGGGLSGKITGLT